MVFGSSFAKGEFLLCILKNMYISVLPLFVSSHEWDGESPLASWYLLDCSEFCLSAVFIA